MTVNMGELKLLFEGSDGFCSTKDTQQAKDDFP